MGRIGNGLGMIEPVYIVVALNVLLAIGVLALARQLWRWRSGLVQLTLSLQSVNVVPGEMGYAIMLRRIKFVEARLGVARFQRRSRQLKQLLQLLSLLRIILQYAGGRSSGRQIRPDRLLRRKSR
ncbi:MAG: hypothetical protein AAFN38_23860 [Cyanobacteria bacterium J06560_5]